MFCRVRYLLYFFFFKQKTAYERRISDWSSDVCSSDLLGHGELLLRQGDAQHVHIGDAVEVERKPAPAAADVEHPLSPLQTQLGGDMGFLVRLRLFKAVVPRSEEHTSELQSLMRISYAVFCLKKKKNKKNKYKNQRTSYRKSRIV